MTVEQLTEMGILVLLRATIFFSCRKYLLRSLYADLQDLSGVEYASNHHRDPLPSPITQTIRDSRKPQGKTEILYSTLSSSVFAGCFSESCLLFLLLMLQGADTFSPSTRLLNWRLSLFLLLACILVLVPAFTSLLLTVGPDTSSARLMPRILFSTLCVALYLLLFSFIPLPASLSVSDTLSATLSRLIVLGTLILGLLSGFGAVSSSWAFLPSKRTAIVPTEQDVATAEYALSSVRDDLERKQEEARRKAAAAAQQGQGSWVSRVMPTFRGDEDKLELQGLETLEYEMSRSLDDLRHRRAIAKFSHTFRGRLLSIGGTLFAVYCLTRYLSCLVNIFFPRTSTSPTMSYPDIVTSILANVLQHLWPEVHLEDVARATRHLSLMLVGVIVMTSIRLVLRSVTRALRLPSRTVGASLMLLLLAQLMVTYLLSTLVQLRASFPPPPTDDDNLFSTIPDFQSGFSKLFDRAFFVSASCALGMRWVADKLGGTPD
ncbi:G protein-coupled receptor 89 [Roridomyces roridus]|uniref:G protein-coupled receptor 89 n=1 Tax=Roridomyces roridus TaxID=1738132 RepID=A0AAD7B211_9AGAR|nr:G protein-coupled receptor 89 [Roridomyces roridus]